MDIQSPSLAILLSNGSSNPLFGAMQNKPVVPAKATHTSMAAKQMEERQELENRHGIDRKMEAFKTAAANAKTLEEALADPTIHKALTDVYEIKILSANADRFADVAASDPEKPGSAVLQSSDRGLIKLAQDLSKSSDGLAFLQDPEYQQSIKDILVSIEFEEKAATSNPAAGNAFYFERQSLTIESGMDILASARIRDVVYGALKIPDSMKSRPIAEQQAALDAKLNYDDFQDAGYVRDLATKYLDNTDIAAPIQKPNAMSILYGGNSGTGAIFNLLS
ncbi:DUF1217 domain-containing protein [Curvivirga aplysinae]|uniref:DUF1217 domain-containing protein n=1 Tax=Curvivirga aplysinae TaxID=2529852 RepID=UPI0012BCEF84|nr:DUF1217 domain-containing protein [Curvivirga aplysinae]MTI09804.1 DUF1217 domain-containing protein [Curvivirga aplysinae]